MRSAAPASSSSAANNGSPLSTSSTCVILTPLVAQTRPIR
jgi:hypothetical protein